MGGLERKLFWSDRRKGSWYGHTRDGDHWVAFPPPSSAGHQSLLGRYRLFRPRLFKGFQKRQRCPSSYEPTSFNGLEFHSIIATLIEYISSPLYRLYAKYNIKPNLSSRYYAAEKEAFNKTLCKILWTKTRKIGMSGSRSIRITRGVD